LRFSAEPFLHGGNNRLRREVTQAFHFANVRAASAAAWHAGQLELQNILRAVIRAGVKRIRGAKQSDERLAQSGRHVHRSRIVRDHEFASADPLDHFGQRSLAGQIEARVGVAAPNRSPKLFISLAAQNCETKFRVLA
jgi:hypothetical protein